MTTKHQEIAEKWLAGSASFEETEWLWAEALSDPEVLTYMETIAGAKKIMEEKAARIKSIDSVNTKSPSNMMYWYATAAIVFISVITGLLLRVDTNPYQIGVTQIDLLELEASKVTRSGSENLSTIDSLLNLGIKATIGGKKKQAIALFNELIAKYPDSESAGIALINLGIIQFNDGKFETALASFEGALGKPIQDEFVIEKAMWFKTYSLVNLKKLEAAKEIALQVFQRDRVYKKLAFVLIKRIDQELKQKTFDDDFELE